MRIKNMIMVGLISSVGGLATSSCKKLPFQEMSTKKVAPFIIERVDSIAQASQNILTDKNYKKFGEDTLAITKDFFNNPAKYVKNLNKSAACNVPKIGIGSYTTMMPIINGKTTILIPQRHIIYEQNFINAKTVINSKKIFTRDGNDMFIPVEYYGIQNPKLKNLNLSR